MKKIKEKGKEKIIRKCGERGRSKRGELGAASRLPRREQSNQKVGLYRKRHPTPGLENSE